MAQWMKKILLFSFVFMLFCLLIYLEFHLNLSFSLFITFATISYHLAIRLLVGFLFDRLMKNQANYKRAWYQLRPWENKLYQALKVKRWKDKMPTYDRSAFDPQLHSWAQIAQAMCQSELVHEFNILLSFLPIVASKWVGAFPVFLITSLAAATYDLLFVFMQRYNRARITKILNRK